jgi:transposase
MGRCSPEWQEGRAGGEAAGIIMILDLHRQGLSVSAIARHCGVDRKTVRRTMKRGLEEPTYGPRPPRPTLLDAFAGYLRERVKAYLGLTGPGFCES